jgi:predicted transcriptional regulator
MSTTIDKVVHLSPERAERLARLAQNKSTTEDALVEKALDLLFDLADEGAEEERKAWRTLGVESLERVWDNDADAVYDNWKELYGVSEG